MTTLIIYCHPYEHSYNHAILEAVTANLTAQRREFETLDLYVDGFDPVYSKAELARYHRGETTDPLVSRYLAALRRATTVIIITPIWWNSVPGILKGFVDKVMKEGPGLSHTVTRTGVRGLLTNVRHCYLLTTSTAPTAYLRFFCGNAPQRIFLNTTLRQLGFSGRHWQNFGGITNSSAKRRERYLKRVQEERFR